MPAPCVRARHVEGHRRTAGARVRSDWIVGGRPVAPPMHAHHCAAFVCTQRQTCGAIRVALRARAVAPEIPGHAIGFVRKRCRATTGEVREGHCFRVRGEAEPINLITRKSMRTTAVRLKFPRTISLYTKYYYFSMNVRLLVTKKFSIHPTRTTKLKIKTVVVVVNSG